MKQPDEPPPEDSLDRLAEFTRQILQVPKSEIADNDNDDSNGTTPIEEPCPDS